MSATAAERFVRRLEKCRAAERAALKAEAGRPPQPDAKAFDAFTAAFWSLRESHLPRDVCRLVAALYFWHPKKGGHGNLGEILCRAAGRAQVAGNQRLLERLMATPLSALHGPLFEAVLRLAGARVPLDWPQLIADLGRWDRPTENGELSVQEAWANSWLNYGREHAY